jgi:uncharacterized protein YtpQ (UPF0354 family)
LRELAVRNLRRAVPRIATQREGGAYMLVAGGTFDSSLLLLEDLWQQIAPSVHGELVACVPTRDVMLYSGSSAPEAIEDLRQTALRMLSVGEATLSGALLRWTGSGWEEYRTQNFFH